MRPASAVTSGARGHRLDAAGDEEVAVARDHGVACPDDRREPRRTEAVDGDAGDRVREPGEQRGEAGDVPIVLARLVRAAEPDVLDVGSGDARRARPPPLRRRRPRSSGRTPAQPSAVSVRPGCGRPKRTTARVTREAPSPRARAARSRTPAFARRHAAVHGALQKHLSDLVGRSLGHEHRGEPRTTARRRPGAPPGRPAARMRSHREECRLPRDPASGCRIAAARRLVRQRASRAARARGGTAPGRPRSPRYSSGK